MDGLDEEGVSHFNGLFSDAGSEFMAFNALALFKIVDAAPGQKGVSRSAANRIIESVSEELLSGSKGFEFGPSYAMLLDALGKHLAADCAAMSPLERRDYILGIFSEGSLRRFSDHLDAGISMMAVHFAKGLEWDSVFIPGVTRLDWPGGTRIQCDRAGLCSRSAQSCRVVDMRRMPDGLIEEIGLPYVGVTRARKAVYASASMQRRTRSGGYQAAYPSCLEPIRGIAPASRAVMDTES